MNALWAIVVALSHEAKAVLSEMTVASQTRYGNMKIYAGSYGSRECLLLQSGMGPVNAEHATRYLLEKYPVTRLISTGYCGALRGGIETSHGVLASSLITTEKNAPAIDPDKSFFSEVRNKLMKENFSFHEGPLITSENPILKKEAKAKLGSNTGAIAVDMESYFVLKAAHRSKKIASLALRFVVDAWDDDLTDTSSFVDNQAGFQPMGLLREAIRRPAILKDLPGLKRQSARARQKMKAAIRSIFGD